jgi:hypothetical protein
MAEPLRRGLRPARRSGLTSPDRSAPQTARAATPNPAPGPGTRTSRRTGKRQEARARIHLTRLLVQQSGRKRAAVIGRWIEAKGANSKGPESVPIAN